MLVAQQRCKPMCMPQAGSTHCPLPGPYLVIGEPPSEAGAWKDSAAVSGVVDVDVTASGALGATVPSWNAADALERAPRSPLALYAAICTVGKGRAGRRCTVRRQAGPHFGLLTPTGDVFRC